MLQQELLLKKVGFFVAGYCKIGKGEVEYGVQPGMKGRNSLKGKRLDGNVRSVSEGAGWPGRIRMAKDIFERNIK